MLKISDTDILQQLENLLDQESYSIIPKVIFEVKRFLFTSNNFNVIIAFKS